MMNPSSRRATVRAGVRSAALWTLAHVSRVWPIAACAIVVALTWAALREIHPRSVRAALHAVDGRWVWIAAAATLLNICAMGLYDVVAFRHTRTRARDRWKYGAVAFAWSQFLTLGPLAGPAVRFWLYRPSVDSRADLEVGVVNVGVGFIAGLAGWTCAAAIASAIGAGVIVMAIVAMAATLVAGLIGSTIARWIGRAATIRAEQLAMIGWIDWLLALAAFAMCLRAVGADAFTVAAARSFFFGQLVGVASLIPGGFGSADAFWIAHLPVGAPTAAAALLVYRAIYYVAPWIVASLLLLSWATRRTMRRIELARRTIAGLVGGAGVLMMLSSASPAIQARLAMVERAVPLSLVEASHLTAALAGVLLLAIARGLSRGYRAAYRATLALLVLAGMSAMLKGFDYEEALILCAVAVAASSQAGLFDRPSRGDWIEGPDVAIAAGAFAIFVLFGVVSHHLGPRAFERWTIVGHRLEGARFVRTAAALFLALLAGASYVALRAPVRFTRLTSVEIDDALARYAAIGGRTAMLTVANGDKAVFDAGGRGFCLYRTIGPYLVVFNDPAVAGATQARIEFLDALFRFAGDCDRRPLFYQLSPEWIPPLHDRGYLFFKLGEEAHVILDRVAVTGSAGKTNRNIVNRAERDGLSFRVVPAEDVRAMLPALGGVSDEWLESKGVRERQFSIGFFDNDYLCRYPCAVVERQDASHEVVAFANLLLDPRGEEVSIDLMRYRHRATGAMDFLFVELLLYGQQHGYRRFNLGMAPLASVGERRGAHGRERLANLVFQHGEHWYNFRGLRFYKQKWDPEWAPRYMAYQDAWEFPMAIMNVSALIAGGWSRVLRGRA